MQYTRAVSVLAFAALLSTACADGTDPVSPVDGLDYARGGVPGAPAGVPQGRAELLTDIPVTGTDENGNAFDGTLTITSLTHDGGQLLASGTLSWLMDGEMVSESFEDVPATLSRTSIASASGITMSGHNEPGVCDILFLDLGPIFLDLLGLQVDLSQITLDLDAVRGTGRLLGNLLCAVTNLLNPGSALSNLLDRVNDILDDIGGLLADVSGALAGGGSLTGTALIQSIERTADGALQVTGVLNGTATLADGTVQTIVDQAFTTTATLSRTAAASASGITMSSHNEPGVCDILFLDIAPIFLDLLGLQVDLSQITLDLDAAPGGGNLLGNLLCAVTGLLDPGSALDRLLDRITNLLS